MLSYTPRSMLYLQAWKGIHTLPPGTTGLAFIRSAPVTQPRPGWDQHATYPRRRYDV